MRQQAFTLIETAKILGVERTTIYRLIENGQIKPIKVGKRQKVTRSNIREILGEDPE